MDFPVVATLHLQSFEDKAEVRKILRVHGFEIKDQRKSEVRVEGSFLKLKAVKAQLEQILNSQTQPSVFPSPHQPVSTGAIPKAFNSSHSVPDGRRSRLESRNRSPLKSPSPPGMFPFQSSNALHNPAGSPQYRTPSSPRLDPYDSINTESKFLAVEGDVYKYAMQLNTQDIINILENHGVQMKAKEVGESWSITVQGRNATKAAAQLQGFLNNLTTSLRTQEVLCNEMDSHGRDLLQRLKTSGNIYNSVLVCDMDDRLHLIGPSTESYELKQKLLGRWFDPPGRTGRTASGNSRRRSSSLPAARRKNTERESGAGGNPSPVTTAGSFISKYQDDGQKPAEPERGASRGRTLSESRGDERAERPKGHVQEKERKPEASLKILKQLLPFSLDQSFSLRKKKKP